jgi:5-methylcytosine-specific restriction endonuclease McrA
MPQKDPIKARDYQRKWYLAHCEEVKARTARRRANNREACLAQSAEWARRNPEKVKAIQARFYLSHNHTGLVREWRRSNPDKAKALNLVTKMTRRARECGAVGFFSYDAWIQKVTYHGWRCIYCNEELNIRTLTIDHRKPLAKGGSNWLSNLVPACKPCNCKKGTKLLLPNP